jgi:hypothetical protein
MTFKDLYNNVFIAEQEEDIPPSEVAMPEDFEGDVEPMPLPEVPVSSEEGEPSTDLGTSSSTTIQGYIDDLESFATKLNATEESSLQKLIAELDKPGTPFEGISRIKADVLRAAEVLRTTSENLKSFIISAAAKK